MNERQMRYFQLLITQKWTMNKLTDLLYLELNNKHGKKGRQSWEISDF